ncbi:enoyl-CoA hydratase [Lineolata rhizophorae]|uniref:Enoyl-CoA hydratase n=1 Tax=Lineolata rhizophorae TaxID=578093 RepID=A0A6A6NZ75_9PEZI|nr:enoyl-CoA hydratase [Lineolata rhizophorae]
MPGSDPEQIKLPDSYANIPFTQIRLRHEPASSPTPTPVIVLTLYRPGKHNAFTLTMMREVEQAFTLFDLDDRVKCVVVTGDGRMFCAGADLEIGFGSGPKERNPDHRDGGGRISLAIHHCRKPVIGALQGSAVGIGITMTLPMTIRVAYSAAKIGFVFARRGIVLEACSSYFLPRLVGMGRALHLVTTGATYRADDRLLDGLFSETCDRAEDVLPRALAIADDVVKNTSTVSTNLMREMMYRGPDSAEGTHLLDSRIIYEMFSKADNKEGVKAFLEKRPVNFTGTMANDAPECYPWWSQVDVSSRPQAANSKSKL